MLLSGRGGVLPVLRGEVDDFGGWGWSVCFGGRGLGGGGGGFARWVTGGGGGGGEGRLGEEGRRFGCGWDSGVAFLDVGDEGLVRERRKLGGGKVG